MNTVLFPYFDLIFSQYQRDQKSTYLFWLPIFVFNLEIILTHPSWKCPTTSFFVLLILPSFILYYISPALNVTTNYTAIFFLPHLASFLSLISVSTSDPMVLLGLGRDWQYLWQLASALLRYLFVWGFCKNTEAKNPDYQKLFFVSQWIKLYCDVSPEFRDWVEFRTSITIINCCSRCKYINTSFIVSKITNFWLYRYS